MLHQARLSHIASSLRTGELNLKDYLNQVGDLLESTEPQIHAFVDEPNRRRRVLSEADDLLEQYPDVNSRPPLFGVPVGVKDLFNVDGFDTRAGSQLPPDLFLGPEASIVTHLKALGAIVLGKTHMDEFAYAAPSPTRNPRNTKHTPGGSSSGSAASVTVGSCPFAIGTQTTRSITAPASFCGVYGFKPTLGRVPVDGLVWMSETLDTVGWFTQDVDSMNWISSLLIPHWEAPELSANPVIAIPRGKFMEFMTDEARETFYRTSETLRGAGFEVVEVDMPWEPILDDLYPTTINLISGEMAHVHEAYLEGNRHLYHPSTLRGIEHGQQFTNEALEGFRQTLLKVRGDLTELMRDRGIDAWITPAQATTAPEGDTPTGFGGMIIPWTAAGLPTLSIPAMELAGMPLGLQLIGGFGEDERLLAVAQRVSTAVCR